MKSICVFCASSLGNDPVYAETAFELGKYLAENQIDLIYGGAQVGLMGKVAEGSLSHNGKVTGIIPGFLKTKEIAHVSLTELITVKTMHERKALMHDKSDAFIALPGGFGTLEELFEILTWAQLSLHKKPIGILNINGYYDPLIQLVEKMIYEELLRNEYKGMLLISDSIEDLISQMNLYEVPFVNKWSGAEIL
ncbi:MAG: TIGR00730 family Rossman fold protein [Moheibacter sp.]